MTLLESTMNTWGSTTPYNSKTNDSTENLPSIPQMKASIQWKNKWLELTTEID